jgi:hypothetical protein
MAETWDWRATYAQYVDVEAPQTENAPYEIPQSPEEHAAGQQAYAAPYGPPQPYVEQPPGYGPYAGPYPQYAAYPPPGVRQAGRGFSIAAFICGGIGLLFFPIILGPLGITFGFVANARGDRVGKWAGLMSIATTALGMVIGVLVAHSLRMRLGG